jgi:hypothetical protein
MISGEPYITQQYLPHDLEKLIVCKAYGDKDGYLRALREMEAGFAGERPIQREKVRAAIDRMVPREEGEIE